MSNRTHLIDFQKQHGLKNAPRPSSQRDITQRHGEDLPEDEELVSEAFSGRMVTPEGRVVLVCPLESDSSY